MEIVDCSGQVEANAFLPTEKYYSDGRAEQADGALLREQDVSVLMNGKPRVALTCVPHHIVEAVMGRLFLEGYISHVRGAVMANIGAAGRVVYVEISRSVFARDGWAQIAPKLEAALGDPAAGRSTLEPRAWNPDYLATLAQSFEGRLAGAARLRGVHTCALAAADDILYQGWDRNPESAFDKAVGAAFIDGIDISACTFVTNGPLGIAGFARLVHAGITVALTLACPTTRDTELARLCRITLADAPEFGCIRILHDARQ